MGDAGRNMNKILCSTGALLKYGGDYKLLEPLSKQLMCDGYEFMMDGPYYEEAESLKSYFRKIKLYVPVIHCEKSIGENISKGGKTEWTDAFEKFEINCDIAQSIGAGKLVIHLWDGLTSDSHFQNNLTGYDQLHKIALQYGLDLLVENVVCAVEDPMKRLCELRDRYPEIHFVFDTKMAAFHGQLDLLYDTEYQWLWKEGHICHYHVNDYAGGYRDWENLRPLPIGEGKIDFSRFFAFINRTGYDGFLTVEATAHDEEGVVDVEMLNQQYRCIKAFIQNSA